MAWRFVAGETREAALDAVRALNARGIRATLDHLGENVTSREEAVAAAAEAIAELRAIKAAGVDANVSVKLTQLGLDLGDDFCREQVRCVLDCARELGNFVRIDMEGSPYTQRTLDLFHKLRRDYDADTVGIVIQSYLRRSQRDIECLIAGGSRVRLVKGAYNESPEIAFPRKADVDRAYRIELELLLARAHYPAIATHDEQLIGRTQGFAAVEGIPESRFEFQMLYGVRRDLQ
jgi:proline dehydrogenase